MRNELLVYQFDHYENQGMLLIAAKTESEAKEFAKNEGSAWEFDECIPGLIFISEENPIEILRYMSPFVI